MKKVVVFGASGNTGTYFVKYFLENNSNKDYEVVAVGTRETQKFDELGVTYYQVDITKKEEFDKLPEDVYAVVDEEDLPVAAHLEIDSFADDVGVETFHFGLNRIAVGRRCRDA